MKLPDEVAYRLGLSEGFLAEAEQDFQLERWRSCVDNSQLAVENAGKVVLASFGIVPKTHDPAIQISKIIRGQQMPEEIRRVVESLLPDLLALGSKEHFLTDYGDEETFTLPWDLFTRQSAEEALVSARRSLKRAQDLIMALDTWRKK